MKRLNYYQVHKNKKPLKRKAEINKFSTLSVKLGLIALNSAMQLKIIESQVSKTKNGQLIKKVECIKVIKETANAMANVFKYQKKQRYLNRLKQ